MRIGTHFRTLSGWAMIATIVGAVAAVVALWISLPRPVNTPQTPPEVAASNVQTPSISASSQQPSPRSAASITQAVISQASPEIPSTPSASKATTVRRTITLTELCEIGESVHECGPGLLTMQGRTFEREIHYPAPKPPSWSTFIAVSSLRCYSIHLQFGVSDLRSGYTTSLLLVSSKADPVKATTQSGQTGHLDSEELGGEPFVVNTQISENLTEIQVKGTLVCDMPY